MIVHVKGVFFLTQKLLLFMNDGGRIVNLSSGLARFALSDYAAYATIKGAVEVLTRYMAKELGARQIAVNTIAPGAIATDFAGGAVRDNPELNQFIASQIALGRVGRPEDMGGAIVLCSPRTNEEPRRRADGVSKLICSWGMPHIAVSRFCPKGTGIYPY